jgi:electron transport complex protein RnfB
MLIAVSSLTALGLGLGGMLGLAARLLVVEEDPLETELQALLPGSQCGQCGFVGCAQAAAALARGEAAVTLCPPGGKAVAEQLAKRLGVTADLSDHVQRAPVYAQIAEELCIGCTRCLKECSVDGIVGANKLMHTVVAEVCHGCAKCAQVCPTQAITMIPVPVTLAGWHWPKPAVETPRTPRRLRTGPGEAALAST